MIQNEYDDLCDILDENDLIICDGIFRHGIPIEKTRNTLLAPWTKPKGGSTSLEG